MSQTKEKLTERDLTRNSKSGIEKAPFEKFFANVVNNAKAKSRQKNNRKSMYLAR